MFDLYQYLPRFTAARLARNGSQTSFIPDVFARAAEQIRRIPLGGRAASPTDRLTLRGTNYVPRVFFALSRGRPPYPLPSYSQAVLPRAQGTYSRQHDRSAGIIRRVNGIGDIVCKINRARGELYSSGCGAVSRFLSLPRDHIPEYLRKPRQTRFGSVSNGVICWLYFTAR